MPTTAMAYGSEYGQDSRQQTQSFGGYNTAATMMYNVPQPSAQTPVYDAQQFGSRQPAAMQMMTPDVTTQYFGSEAGSAGASSLQQPAPGSGAPANVYQQNNPMSYGGNMSNVSAMPQPSASADVSMAEEHDYADGALEEKWVNYQRQLGTIFQEIDNGSLESASETLLSVSSWLLSQVADLGLNLDDTSLHADRIKLWNDFNYAWLALGQKQRELMESGQPPSRSQGLMSRGTIKKMGNELIRLCDGIERHGLVDYQYGVWEERITGILEVCLDLYESSEDAGGSSGSR
ncbi:Fc.00g052970.m01.CDS01 [Cosmosporella sp. VM-42]